MARPTTPPARAERRPTRQQAAVMAALDQLDTFVSAQDLHSRMRSGGDSIGLATVYRTLQGMADGGELDVLRTADGESAYRRCSDGHHHHLVCRTCRRTVEVEGAGVERWAAQVACQHGFTDVEHLVEVFGTCSTCAGG